MFIPWWIIIIIILVLMGSYGNMKRRLESEISELENRIEELEEGRETTITTDYYELEEDNSL